MNKFIGIGNLTRDPETRTTTSGVNICSFDIAVRRRYAKNDDKPDYYRVNAWRQLGERCQQFLAKGKKIAVIGELQPRTYDDKQGKTRISLEIAADEVEFLSPRELPKSDVNGDVPELGGFEQIDSDTLPF